MLEVKNNRIIIDWLSFSINTTSMLKVKELLKWRQCLIMFKRSGIDFKITKLLWNKIKLLIGKIHL